MHPIIWRISDAFAVKSYGIAIAVAFLLGIWLSARRARAQGLKYNDFIDMGFWVLIAAVVGARLFYVLFHLKEYAAQPANISKVWHGGLIFYGGLFLAVITAIVFMKRRGIPVWLGGDVIAPQIALGYAITRIGCFLNGCCFGSATSLPWGVKFPAACGAGHYSVELFLTGRHDLPVRLHPTQLYAAAASLVILAVLLLAWRRRRFDGEIFWGYLILYSVYRFAIEFIRGDNQPLAFHLTVAQFMSVILFVCALAAWFNLRARGVIRGATPGKAKK